MEKKKQSSIEWLYNKMYEHRGNITVEEFEQVKAMHREEIQNSFVEGTQFICEDELGARFEATMYYVMNYENEN